MLIHCLKLIDKKFQFLLHECKNSKLDVQALSHYGRKILIKNNRVSVVETFLNEATSELSSFESLHSCDKLRKNMHDEH